MGCAMQQGTQGFNTGRQCSIAAGVPASTAGMSVDRYSSGLMAIAAAAKQFGFVDHVPVMVAGGLDSISLVQNEHTNLFRVPDPNVIRLSPNIHMPMIDTAEVVAKRYGVSRETQDQFALQSQHRTAGAGRRATSTTRSCR